MVNRYHEFVIRRIARARYGSRWEAMVRISGKRLAARRRPRAAGMSHAFEKPLLEVRLGPASVTRRLACAAP